MIQNTPLNTKQVNEFCDNLQKEELYALSTIYLNDFEYIRQVHPFAISIYVVPFVPQDYYSHDSVVFGSIEVDLPVDYPLKTQRFNFEIQGLSKNFTPEMVKEATKVCDKVIDMYEKESEGQSIVFAVVEAFRDWVTEKCNYFQDLYELQNKKFDENTFYIPPMPKFSTHTQVTVENFLEWKKKFDQEMHDQKKRDKLYFQQEEIQKKISGKQFFMSKRQRLQEQQQEEEIEQVEDVEIDDDDVEEVSDEDYSEHDEDDDDEYQPLYEREDLE